MFDTMKAKLVGAGVALTLLGTAAGGAALSGITAAGAQTPPANTPTVTEPAGTQPEAPETAAETAEANEPQLPGGGHADADGIDVQHDFQGIQ